MTKIKIYFKNKWFTLVELVVVITIIAILSVSTGIILTKWLGKTNDVRTIADLNQIEKSMDIEYIEKAKYPMPDNYVTITWTWWLSDVLWYQWKLWNKAITNIDSLIKIPEDINTENRFYTYSVTSNQKKYQIGSIVSEEQFTYNTYLDQVYANGYISILRWNYDDKFILKKNEKVKKHTQFQQ